MNETKQLLGPDGEPISVLASDLRDEVASATLTGVRAVWQEPVSTNLDPARLGRILRDSETPGGDPVPYLTLLEEVEKREPHYRSVLSTRKLALRALRPVMEAASDDAIDQEIAEACRAIVSSTGFRLGMMHGLDGLSKGYGMIEIGWETTPERWTPKTFARRPPTFFRYDRLTMTQIGLAVDGAIDPAPLPRFRFIRHEPALMSATPLSAGLGRVAVWSYLLKSFNLRDWLAFIDAYGVPVKLGKLPPNASQADRPPC